MRPLLCLMLVALPVLGQEWAVLPQTVSLRFCGRDSPTRAWAAARIAAELRTVHHLHAEIGQAGPDLFHGASRDTAVLVLGCAGDSEGLAAWCREQGLAPAAFAARPESYRVVVRTNPVRLVIVAGSDLGLWYGACGWLDGLRKMLDGAPATPAGEFGGAPALPYRFTRGLTPRGSPASLEESVSWLDWWARWRLNVTIVGGATDRMLPEFLREAHLRGIRVLHGLGVRNLCASDDDAIKRLSEEFRRYLQEGGDGVSMLWDDLPHARCGGHCDRCRARFGPNSLPHEIVRILEALCDVAAQSPSRPLVVWCPPHYSEQRYPEMSDEEFFRVIGASRKVREQTHLYYCEFAPEKLAVLDRHGLTRRIWWYNGLRTVYHVAHHWPSPPGIRLAIPGVKTFEAPDFAPFEVGWKTGSGVSADGDVIRAPGRTWQHLQALPTHYQGYYPCTATHPYHAALGGVFAFNPGGFNQAEADQVIFRAMFGPDTAELARAWSAAYAQLQIQLAQHCEGNSRSNGVSEVATQLTAWRALAGQFRARVRQDRSLLPPNLLASVLARMAEAETEVARLAERDGPVQTPPAP